MSPKIVKNILKKLNGLWRELFVYIFYPIGNFLFHDSDFFLAILFKTQNSEFTCHSSQFLFIYLVKKKWA